ncbi:MAG: hypothetical protein HY708_02115 [Ignavibacteriae bacterium]|nr:hypothetical protein [Ignavibacteriota bacterium]
MLGVVAPVFHWYVQDGGWQFAGVHTTFAVTVMVSPGHTQQGATMTNCGLPHTVITLDFAFPQVSETTT